MNTVSIVVIVAIIVAIVVFILLRIMGQGSGEKPPVTYAFKFETKDYEITEPNLKSAVNGNIFSKVKLTSNQTQITLDKDFQDTKTYWVTRDNLKKVTILPKVT